ncbi:MAG: hypothetical protein PHY16_10655 [Methylobacter sp.]|nr:hypothetical protein [Methylobacter sp.]
MQAEIRQQTKINWFGLQISIEARDIKITFAEVEELMRKRGQFVWLSNEKNNLAYSSCEKNLAIPGIIRPYFRHKADVLPEIIITYETSQ